MPDPVWEHLGTSMKRFLFLLITGLPGLTMTTVTLMMCGGLLVEVRDSPKRIFGPWARWNRAPPDVQSSWETAAAAAVAAVTRTLWTLRSNNMRLEPPDMDIEVHLGRGGTARYGH